MSPLAATSYCLECDALPHSCDHNGPRYLDEIVYQTIDGNLAYRQHHHLEPLKESKTIREPGFRVPPAERERFNRPVMGSAPISAPLQIQARPIQTLIVELEGWIDMGGPLERTLRSVYEMSPTRVTRLSESVIEGAKSGRLKSPGGLLYKRLQEIGASE